MDNQDLINWLIGGLGAVIGFLIRMLWVDVVKLGEKVAAIDVLVAGSYVKKDEFDRYMSRIFEKLDRIEVEVTNKQDRE